MSGSGLIVANKTSMFDGHYLHAEHHGWGEYPCFSANETYILLIDITTFPQYHSNIVKHRLCWFVAFPMASAATRSCSCCSLSGGLCQLTPKKYLSSRIFFGSDGKDIVTCQWNLLNDHKCLLENAPGHHLRALELTDREGESGRLHSWSFGQHTKYLARCVYIYIFICIYIYIHTPVDIDIIYIYNITSESIYCKYFAYTYCNLTVHATIINKWSCSFAFKVLLFCNGSSILEGRSSMSTIKSCISSSGCVEQSSSCENAAMEVRNTATVALVAKSLKWSQVFNREKRGNEKDSW